MTRTAGAAPWSRIAGRFGGIAYLLALCSLALPQAALGAASFSLDSAQGADAASFEPHRSATRKPAV